MKCFQDTDGILMFPHPGVKHKQKLKTKEKVGKDQHTQQKKLLSKQSLEAEQKVAMKREQIQRKERLQNGLNRIRLNYLRNQDNPKRYGRKSRLTGQNTRQRRPSIGRRMFYPLARQNQRKYRANNENIHHEDTVKNRILAIEKDNTYRTHLKDAKVDRIDNRIRALEEEMLLAQHKLPLKETLRVAPQAVKLDELENVSNVHDVISALDAELPQAPEKHLSEPVFRGNVNEPRNVDELSAVNKHTRVNEQNSLHGIHGKENLHETIKRNIHQGKVHHSLSPQKFERKFGLSKYAFNHEGNK